MTKYVNNSEVVTHGINAPVVSYNQITPQKELMRRQQMPDIDVGGKWTKAIPQAISSFASGMAKGAEVRQKQAEEDRKAALQQAKNEFATQMRKLSAKHLQDENYSLAAYENDVRVLQDTYSRILPEDDLADIASKHSSGLLSLAQDARKSMQKDEIDMMNTRAKDFIANHAWAQNWSYGDVVNMLSNAQYSKDNAFRYNGLWQQNPEDKAAFNMAVDSLYDDIVINLNADANDYLQNNKDGVLDETWLQQTKNRYYGALVAAKLDHRVVDVALEKAVNDSVLQTIVNGNEKVLNLTKTQQERALSIYKDSVALDTYRSNPGLYRLEVAVGKDTVGRLVENRMVKNDEVALKTNSIIDKYTTTALSAEETKILLQNKEALPSLVKALRDRVAAGGDLNNELDSTVAYNTLGLVEENNKGMKTEEEAKTVEENNNKLPLDTLKKQAQANINSGNPSLQQKGKKTLDRISYIKSQTVAAHIMRPQFNPTANGFMKIKGTVVSENLRYDPYSKELYLKEPKGFIEKSATAIDKITDLYNKYLEDANNLINNAVANDSDVNADYVADALDIIIEPRSVLEDIPEEEKPLTSDETYAESRELNKDLFEPLTATASVSSSTPIAGASLDYSKYSIGEDLDNAIKADERVAAQMGEYDTNLGAGGEAAFSVWRQNLPKNLQSTDDYDLRGFYKKHGAEAIEEGQHLTDEFKKPNHPTFSKKSKYYKKGMWAGEWDEDGNFIIPLITPKDRLQELIQYWKNSDERGVILVDNPKAEKELEKTEKEISKYTEQLNDEHESEDTKRLIRQELKKLNMKRNSLERQIIVDTYNE